MTYYLLLSMFYQHKYDYSNKKMQIWRFFVELIVEYKRNENEKKVIKMIKIFPEIKR